VADEFDDFSMSANDDATEVSMSSSSDESEVLNTPYQRVTPLFRNIEKENWETVLLFLKTGKWSSSLFANMNEHMRSPAPEIQVRTWVTSYDRRGDPEWSQLPLHAAISYSAPVVVIKQLIELYPKAIQCTDNEGMLPIHLAYGFGAADNILALLMEPFPTSINEKGLGGRYPYECCELGPMKVRGKVYKIVSEQIESRVTSEIDRDWKEFAMAAQDSIGLSNKQDAFKTTLHEFLLDLLKERKELYDIKHRKGQRRVSSARSTSSSRVASSQRSSAPSVRTRSATPSSKLASSSGSVKSSKSKSSGRWGRPKSPFKFGKKYSV
jgi:ankyrin repeat protein